MASLEFNAAEVEPNDSFELLPAGKYRVCITDSEMKPTKKGDGTLLKLKLQVLDGQYQNRTIFDQLNYRNPNPTAQQIGLGTLSAICRAVGKMEPKDTAELHNIPLVANVKVSRQEGYDDRNEVKGYSKDGGASPVQHQAVSQPGSAGAWAQQVR